MGHFDSTSSPSSRGSFIFGSSIVTVGGGDDSAWISFGCLEMPPPIVFAR
jgi:hypothetical protein